jgi:hypothetical protein
MSGAPIKKLPASPSVGLPGAPVPDCGSEKINVSFGYFGAGTRRFKDGLNDRLLRLEAMSKALSGPHGPEMIKLDKPQSVRVAAD